MAVRNLNLNFLISSHKVKFIDVPTACIHYFIRSSNVFATKYFVSGYHLCFKFSLSNDVWFNVYFNRLSYMSNTIWCMLSHLILGFVHWKTLKGRPTSSQQNILYRDTIYASNLVWVMTFDSMFTLIDSSTCQIPSDVCCHIWTWDLCIKRHKLRLI